MLRVTVVIVAVIAVGLNAYTVFAQEPPEQGEGVTISGQAFDGVSTVGAAGLADNARLFVNLSVGDLADKQCPDVLYGCYDDDGDGTFDDGAVSCLRQIGDGEGGADDIHGWSFTIPQGYSFHITEVLNYDDHSIANWDGGLWSSARGQFLFIPPNTTLRFTTPIIIIEGDRLCPLYSWASFGLRHEVIVHGELVSNQEFDWIIFPISAFSSASLILLAFLLGIVLARRLRLQWV